MSRLTASTNQVPQLIGNSPAITKLREQIALAARTNAKVLILGETGVGKEVAARQLHEQSARRFKSFVAVNCSGVPETLLESELFGHMRGSFTDAYRDKAGLVRRANEGTLFLDELGEMSLRMQSALLRFTETGEVQAVGADGPTTHVDVRLITATNRDLRSQVAAGAFREDLFYRLNVIQIHISPLRERGEDILLLMRHYLEQAAATFSIAVPELTPDASAALLEYAWPGNIRELRNVSERLALSDHRRAIRADDLPIELQQRYAAKVVVGSTPGVTVVGTGTPEQKPVVPELRQSETADKLWQRLTNGEDFWTVVHKPYKARELARPDLVSIIDRGLQHTHGSYRALLKVFHLPASDYKRFHAFLYQQQCNLPVAGYRQRVRRSTQSAAVM
jgi:DNA-binding NtrC family response regulator